MLYDDTVWHKLLPWQHLKSFRFIVWFPINNIIHCNYCICSYYQWWRNWICFQTLVYLEHFIFGNVLNIFSMTSIFGSIKIFIVQGWYYFCTYTLINIIYVNLITCLNLCTTRKLLSYLYLYLIYILFISFIYTRTSVKFFIIQWLFTNCFIISRRLGDPLAKITLPFASVWIVDSNIFLNVRAFSNYYWDICYQWNSLGYWLLGYELPNNVHVGCVKYIHKQTVRRIRR